MNDARLSRLEGKVDQMAEKVTRAVTLMEAASGDKAAERQEIRDIEERVADLEKTRSTLIGWIVGSGFGGAGFGALMAKFFGH